MTTELEEEYAQDTFARPPWWDGLASTTAVGVDLRLLTEYFAETLQLVLLRPRPVAIYRTKYGANITPTCGPQHMAQVP